MSSDIMRFTIHPDNEKRLVLAVPVTRSFQLTDQAIDRNQNSESDVHPQQRNQHQYRHLQAYYFHFR